MVVPLFSKRHMTAVLEFAKRHLKDSQTMRNKIIWSDETNIEVFGRNGGSIILWGSFSAAGTGKLVRIKGKLNGAKYRDP